MWTVNFLSLTTDFELSETCELLSWYLRGCNVFISLQLYSSAISQQSLEEIPTYWHKNYGLVCQRLLSLKHDLPVTDLLDKAIFHYEMFVKLDPMDEHYKAITEAVKQMKVQRQSLNG